eukprot:4647520-Pleurochrysis_carterae.AAC.2
MKAERASWRRVSVGARASEKRSGSAQRSAHVLAERCGRESAVARQRPLRAVLLPLPKLIGRPNELGPEEELILRRASETR